MMIQAIRLTRKKAALAVILAGAVLAALIVRQPLSSSILTSSFLKPGKSMSSS